MIEIVVPIIVGLLTAAERFVFIQVHIKRPFYILFGLETIPK